MLKSRIWYLVSQIVYKFLFGEFGKGSRIIGPLQLDEIKSIYIKNNVYIAQNAWIMGNRSEICTLTIESQTNIGHNIHIIAKKSVVIEKSVLIADKVFISDCTHCYEDANIPVLKQEVKIIKPVTIGEGSWLGENVCVCGASIGKHCVIGANSVVIKDIPDYCVAVGIPAKVIKRFDFKKEEWIKVQEV